MITVKWDKHRHISVSPHRIIAIEHENDIETVAFFLPRRMGEVDLSELTAVFTSVNQEGLENAETLPIEIVGSQIKCEWKVLRTYTDYPGTLQYEIVFSGYDLEFRTIQDHFTILPSLNARGILPVPQASIVSQMVEIYEDTKELYDSFDVQIGSNGNWKVKGADTGISATGTSGQDGISVTGVQEKENGHLYVSLSDGRTVDAGYIKGDTGSTGTIEVGSVITGLPGTEAAVVNTGTDTAAVLNFTIPRGEPGEVTEEQLAAKVDKNDSISGATKCKITYDDKGLVTTGDNLSAEDIPMLELAKISDAYSKQDTILASGILKSDGEGNVVAAIDGEDYISTEIYRSKAEVSNGVIVLVPNKSLYYSIVHSPTIYTIDSQAVDFSKGRVSFYLEIEMQQISALSFPMEFENNSLPLMNEKRIYVLRCTSFDGVLWQAKLDNDSSCYRYVGVSGSLVSVDNTVPAQLWNVEISGKTVQPTKNLLNTGVGSGTFQGITYLVDNGIITLNGTATATIRIKLTGGIEATTQTPIESNWTSGCFLQRGRYSLSMQSVSGTKSNYIELVVLYSDASVTEVIYSATTNALLAINKIISVVYVIIPNGEILNDFVFYPIIECGVSITPWQSPTPTQTYSLQLKSTTGGSDIFLTAHSKNYFNDAFDYGYITDSTGETLTAAGNANYRTTVWLRCKPSQSYVISGGYNRNVWQCRDLNGSVVNKGSFGSITTESNSMWLRVYYCNFTEGVPSGIIQIEEGTVSTSYETYSGTDKTLPLSYLGNQPLRSLPSGTCDRIYRSVVNEQWCIERDIGRVDLTGTENWRLTSTAADTATFELSMAMKNNGIAENDIMCSHFQNKVAAISGTVGVCNVNGSILVLSSSKKNLIGWDDGATIEHKVSTFKSWLSANHTTLIYQLAESETIELPAEAQDILNGLYAKKGKTVICSMNEIPAVISADIPARIVAE